MALLAAARGARRSTASDRILLGIASIAFFVTTYVAWRNLPPISVAPLPLAVAALFAFIAVVVNGWEYREIAAAFRRRVSWVRALRVSALSSAANLLPVPGAVLVKSRALRQEGERYRQGAPVVVAAGVLWLAAAALAGGITWVAARPGAGSVLFAGGVAGIAAAAALVPRGDDAGPSRWQVVARMGTVEVVSVLGTCARLYAITVGLGVGSLRDAVTLTIAAILASAVGLVPAGLGVRELLSAGAGAIAGFDPAVGVAIATLDRVISMAVIGVLALWFSRRQADGAVQRPDATEVGQ